MSISISASVGEAGINRPDDLATVQSLFNKFRAIKLTEPASCPPNILEEFKNAKGNPKELQVKRDVKCWPQTIEAIKEFQKGFLPKPDGRVDPNGTTWRKLVAAAGELAQGRKLLLTFDDGPDPESALNSILNTLDRNSIKGEFYVVGKEVKSLHEAAKRIVDRGHKIQNHTSSHRPDLIRVSERDVLSEVKRTQDVIKEATGATATKVRPPFGTGGWPNKYDPEIAKVAKDLSLAIENWDIDTEDWKAPKGIEGEKIKNVEAQFWLVPGKTTLNVLMHVLEETARDLPGFVSQLRKWNFEFAQP
jgi:peptidoglycan/xylan/chitin deacetylase (PgdA/CDA1 family)